MPAIMRDQSEPLIMSAVVAMAANRVIGDGSGLIWHLPDDLKRVKALTMGCPLIMGRKTWDSIGRPLPGRGSIVMTRDKKWRADGAVVACDFIAAVEAAKAWIYSQNPQCRKIILFGGGEVYRVGLDYCHQIDLTVIEISPDGGQNAVRFPKVHPKGWARHVEAKIDSAGDVPGYRYERWCRAKPPNNF